MEKKQQNEICLGFATIERWQNEKKVSILNDIHSEMFMIGHSNFGFMRELFYVPYWTMDINRLNGQNLFSMVCLYRISNFFSSLIVPF